ncbi:MAG: cytochrome C oxidase subunit IV family protein [Ilumatobacteraceae bacterium]|nr:MAG: cytochrome C oxidase subunit IV family protein [Actinomycetota bacterium]
MSTTTDTVAPSIGYATVDDEGHTHGATDKQYLVIAIILAVLTAIEVSTYYLDFGAAFLPVLLVLMAAKFVIVVSFFMHLRFDNKIFSFMFYGGLFLALGVYVGTLATFEFFLGT